MSIEVRGRTLFLSEGGDRSGVDVTYTRKTRSLSIGGWYDCFMGIPAQELTLAEFLMLLNVRKADLVAILQEIP